MRKLLVFLLVLVACAATAARAASTPPSVDVKTLPGYAEAKALGFDLADEKLSVEVNLQRPLIQFAAELTRGQESGIADALAKIESVVLRLYKLTPGEVAGARETMNRAAAALEKRGWLRTVMVRDEKQHLLLFFRPEGTRMVGVTALFLDTEPKFGFLNIAGEVDPAEIARIGRSLNIDVLEHVDGSTPTDSATPPAHNQP